MIVTVIGYGDITGAGAMNGVDVAVTVVGSIASLVLGLMRGRADRVSIRDGSPFVQWGVASLVLFAGNLVVKVLIDLVGLAAGGTLAAAVHSLVFTLGFTLVGEAIVVWLRSGSAELPEPLRNFAVGLGVGPVAEDGANISEPIASGR